MTDKDPKHVKLPAYIEDSRVKPSPMVSPTESLRHYVQAATADNTRKTYRSAIKQFERWGGRLPTDRDTLVRYLLARAETLNPRTLALHLTAIRQWHRYQGMTDPAHDPLVTKTLTGIQRLHGRPKRKAKALRLEHVAAMVAQLRGRRENKKTRRDVALVLVGFFGAFRRQELVSLTVADLHWEPEGLLIQLPRSKTDQTGEGLGRALPFGEAPVCPGAALRAWLDSAEITEGPLFRPINRWDVVQPKALHPGAVNGVLKELGRNCGFDFVPELSSHSFRRGLSTSAARAQVPFELIKKQGGWKSDATVWGYIEEGQLWTENAASTLMGKLATLVGDF